jgi:adenosylcobinamide kinase/adenosylcobinamide-phosphate guanylyltransferase
MQQTQRNALTLVLGGARSGKSRYAQQLGERTEKVVFVATAHASDEAMRRKIERHRDERPHQWLTVEEPLELAATIEQHGPGADLLLIDCLTLYAANLLDAGDGAPEEIDRRVDSLCLALAQAPCAVVLVSNEVGSGVVPAYPSGRRYRDLLGEINQKVARVSDEVVLIIAGLPLQLKRRAASPDPCR